MPRTLLGELMAAITAAILLTTVLVGVALFRIPERADAGAAALGLQQEAVLAARLAAPVLSREAATTAHGTGERGEASRLTRDLAQVLSAEVVLADARGIPRGHATPPGRAPLWQRDREEVRQALAGRPARTAPGRDATAGYGRGKPVGGGPVLAAAPARDGERLVGVVWLARARVGERYGSRALVAPLVGALGAGALLALGLTYRLARRVGQALAEISAIARKMAAGELQQRVPVSPPRELAELGRAFNSMAARVRDIVGQLWQERNKLVTILKKMTDGIVLTDADGRITLLNPAAQRILGLNADAVTGRTLLETTLNYPLHAMLEQAIRDRTEVADEVRVTLDAARALQLQAYAAPVESETRAAEGAMLVLHDLTELRRLEEVRKQFVANASHELRTPLTAIKMTTETLLLGAKEKPEDRDRFLAMINTETDRLVALVNDLLDLSRIESGAARIHLERVPVRPLLAEVRDEMQSRAEERSQALLMDAPEGLAARADPSALRQILLNLVDNALKYTPTGGRVEINAAPVGDSAQITVRDTGIGIPSADIHRIFERFYRVDKARSRQLGGTGLGLAIVKHLLEAQHGTIAVESELNRGSSFTISLPREPERGVSLPDDEPSPDPSREQTLTER
jgi:two-component system phosphate regulon sensor histidine kinase PhoR